MAFQMVGAGTCGNNALGIVTTTPSPATGTMFVGLIRELGTLVDVKVNGPMSEFAGFAA